MVNAWLMHLHFSWHYSKKTCLCTEDIDNSGWKSSWPYPAADVGYFEIGQDKHSSTKHKSLSVESSLMCFLQIKGLLQRTALFVFLKSIKSVDFCRLKTIVLTEKIIPFRKIMILQRYIYQTSAKKTSEHNYDTGSDMLACLQHKLVSAKRTKPPKKKKSEVQNPLPYTFVDSLHISWLPLWYCIWRHPEVFEDWL